MAELRDKNKSMKDELFRLSQRYSRRMSMVSGGRQAFVPLCFLFMLCSFSSATRESASLCGQSCSEMCFSVLTLGCCLLRGVLLWICSPGPFVLL